MLSFFKDQALTRPISSVTPKTFLLPLAGATTSTRVWLGDPYFSTLSAAANSGDATVNLTDTSEFFSAGGTATIGGASFTYTGKTQATLTGCSGIAASYTVGTKVIPSIVYYPGTGNLVARAAAPDQTVLIQLSPNAGSTPYGFAGMPAIYSSPTQIAMGVAVPLDIQLVAAPSASATTNTGCQVTFNPLYIRDSSNLYAPAATEVGITPRCPLLVSLGSHAPDLTVKLLPADRSLPEALPGFVLGQYRWRGADNDNAVALSAPNWSLDPATIGLEKFLPGIGYGSDLELVDLEVSGDFIYPRLTTGEYFTGAYRYYYPAAPVLDIFPAAISTAFTLSQTPAVGKPIYVGNYLKDGQGYYDQNIRYTYVGTVTNPDGSARTDLPDYYFTLNRATKLVTINKVAPAPDLVVGALSGNSADTFFVPVYPIEQITQVYILNADGTPIYSDNFSLSDGVLTVQSSAGPAIAGGTAGQAVFITWTPSLAVFYDTGTADGTWLEESIDVNPAFAGISSGNIYLEHRVRVPFSISLVSDKPLTATPASEGFNPGILSYGPVYFSNDYALVLGTAYSQVPGEIVPNARLRVVPWTGFTGLLNYLDPTAAELIVETGGDGKVSLVYTPQTGAGTYLPTTTASGSLGGLGTTTVTDDTFVLPAAVPLSEVYDTIDGWYVTPYLVYNNDPIYGSTTANIANGEVAWATQGTPGTSGYKTNGSRQAWTIAGQIVEPIQALDSSGVNFNQGGFNGSVVKLVFGQAIPTGATIGAYFLTFRAQVILQLQSVDNPEVYSNPILLEMAAAPLINENPWLRLNDSVQGLLNQFRLGKSPAVPTQV